MLFPVIQYGDTQKTDRTREGLGGLPLARGYTSDYWVWAYK